MQAGNDGVDALQRENHVAIPVKEKIDFGGTTAGDGLDFLQAGDAVDGFLERTRDDHEHLVDRHNAVVDADDDAREVGVREDRDRNGEGKIRAHEHEGDDQK